MSKNKKNVNKVEFTESKVVNIIEKIVIETVAANKAKWLAEEKTKWIAEQKNTDEKNRILETRLNKIENFLSKATITKKK